MFAQEMLASFSKALEARTLHTSNFVIKEVKGRTMISCKQNFENEAFKMGFTLLKIKLTEKFKLKVKLTVTKV